MTVKPTEVPTLNENEDSTKVPESIAKAIEILNRPSNHSDVVGHNLDYHDRHNDSRRSHRHPNNRIEAKAEWLPFQEKWCLYVEWDDSEPLTARNIVNRVAKEFGLLGYVASGCTSNVDIDGNKKFSSNAQVSFLNLTEETQTQVYRCEDCNEESRGTSEISLEFGVEG